MNHAPQVYVEHPRKVVDAKLDKRREVTHPGVVDHNVDAPVLGQHAIGQGLHAVSIADIGENRQGAYLLGRLVQHTGLNVGNHHARTLAHQGLGHAAANARSTARDHTDQTVKRSDACFTHAHASHRRHQPRDDERTDGVTMACQPRRSWRRTSRSFST